MLEEKRRKKNIWENETKCSVEVIHGTARVEGNEGNGREHRSGMERKTLTWRRTRRPERQRREEMENG